MSYKIMVSPNIWGVFLPCGRYLYFCGLYVILADKYELALGSATRRVMLYVDVHDIILCRVAWDEKLPHHGIRLCHGICGLLYIENWENHKCCGRCNCCEQWVIFVGNAFNCWTSLVILAGGKSAGGQTGTSLGVKLKNIQMKTSLGEKKKGENLYIFCDNWKLLLLWGNLCSFIDSSVDTIFLRNIFLLKIKQCS